MRPFSDIGCKRTSRGCLREEKGEELGEILKERWGFGEEEEQRKHASILRPLPAKVTIDKVLHSGSQIYRRGVLGNRNIYANIT